MQINAQRHTILLIAAFRGVNWRVFHLPGIQTLPVGNRAKPSIPRMGDKLLDTPSVSGHSQRHGWGALPVASSTNRHS
jgi:hypothetical protein